MNAHAELPQLLLNSDVLVVDDNAAYARIICLRLQAIGCTCHTAGTPEEAMQLLRTHSNIRVAIVDYQMGSVDVDSLVLDIRRTRPDVVMVGNSTMPRAPEFDQLGVDLFLRKPRTNEDLIDILGQAISE